MADQSGPTSNPSAKKPRQPGSTAIAVQPCQRPSNFAIKLAQEKANGWLNDHIKKGMPRQKLSEEEIAQAEKILMEAEEGRAAIPEDKLAATGIQPEEKVLNDSLEAGVPKLELRKESTSLAAPSKENRDFFKRLSNTPEIVMELAKHLDIKSLISLYAIQRDVNDILNGHLSHAMHACAAYRAPESARVFAFTLYDELCCVDPAGRPHPRKPDTVRRVPSLRWLQMVYHREKTVRDILACMARQGHHMPPEMTFTLKKMWVVMDIATNAGRVQVMHSSKYFTAMDLYRIQMFVVKLDMRFNDPIDGPAEDHLRKLLLGQRGLTPLCRMLRREVILDAVEVIKAAVRYDWRPSDQHRHLPIWGIPCHEIGVGHLEGWGKGRVHLFRPDELVVREVVRRRLDLKNHIMGMMLWGYVDTITGENIPTTEEEKYMSDDEEKKHTALWEDYEWFDISLKDYGETKQSEESNERRSAEKKKEEMAKEAKTRGENVVPVMDVDALRAELMKKLIHNDGPSQGQSRRARLSRRGFNL